MSRGITIKIDRLQAIRILGEAMRQKKQQFDRERESYPRKLEHARMSILFKLKSRVSAVEKSTSSQQLSKLCEDVLDYRERNDLIPNKPALNLCQEKQLLLMLQNDVRKVVPINSNHELWSILQGKCEVLS